MISCNDNSGSGEVPSKCLTINTLFYKTTRAFTTWPIYDSAMSTIPLSYFYVYELLKPVPVMKSCYLMDKNNFNVTSGVDLNSYNFNFKSNTDYWSSITLLGNNFTFTCYDSYGNIAVSDPFGL